MSPARARRTGRARHALAHRRRRPHIHTVSFDPAEDAWVDALVHVLEDHGSPCAARSAIVRVALHTLHEALTGFTQQEIATFFVERDADLLRAIFDRTPRLPFD
jgi:hypothetical protein